jgi:1-acyl-sn-glycerol-3-phosphate acyltransferase
LARSADSVALIPAAPSPRVRTVFTAMVGRKMRSAFHTVRIAHGSRAVLERLASGDRPALVVLNHASWWDPILALILWREFFPRREPYGPIDRDELQRFGILKKVGLFGIDPDEPASMAAMRDYLIDLAARDPRLALVVTPQGHFADVRDEIMPRPGAAAMAAMLLPDRAASVAVEYGFWVDQKPEIFLRAVEIDCTEASTLGWHRRITDAMRANQTALAPLVRARDARAFEPLSSLFAPKVTGTNPIYDLWLRLTGRRANTELGEARDTRTAQRGLDR